MLLVVALISIALAAGCTKREDLVVARVETKEITVADFENAAELLDNKYLPATDDLEGRKELLDHIINKEVMALKARDAGYETEEWFQNLFQRFRGPFLVAALMDQLVRKKVEVSDQEIDYYFDKMKYEYTLSQLVVAGEDEAWELRERMLAGEDFAEIAKKYSLDASAPNGGFVGASPVGRILWWVEEALFDMKADDVSVPLKTEAGWALLKVHRIREVEPRDDRDYAARRVRGIKEKKGIEQLKAKIEKEIGLTWYTDALTIAYDALPEDIPFEDIISYKVSRENAPKLDLPDQYREMVVCTFADEALTLADFAEYYDLLGLPDRPRREKGKGDVMLAIHKKVFDAVLPDYAEQQAKILEIPEVREALDMRKEQFLVQKLYQDQILNEINVTLREIEIYYEENKENIIVPEQRDYSIVIVNDEQTAQEVVKRAKTGYDFAELVKAYSLDPNAKENLGRTGLTYSGHYPDYDNIAFSLPKAGAISDVFRTPRGWAVVKVEEIKQAQTPTMLEATQTIKKSLTDLKAEELLKEKLQIWREGYPIEVIDKNLAKAKLARTRL
jgi:foldase protein PrsA